MTQAEVYTTLLAIDAFYQAEDGLQRDGRNGTTDIGIMRGGRADLEAVAQWVYQVAVLGRSLDEVKALIRQSEEYRSKHAGEAPPRYDFSHCVVEPGEPLVRCVHAIINPVRSIAGAFTVTRHVAWLLRDRGFGLLRKNGGENVATWKGIGFAAARLVLPDGHLYKILTDVPSTNGPSWQDQGIDPALAALYVPPIDTSLP